MDYKQLCKALRRKLNAYPEREHDHIYYIASDYNGKEKRVGKISHNQGKTQTVDIYFLKDTARRLCVDLDELTQFIDCTLSGPEVRARWPK